MAWTVPSGCYYAVWSSANSWVYYNAGASVSDENAPNKGGAIHLANTYVLIDFSHGYIYNSVPILSGSSLTINIATGNKFTVSTTPSLKSAGNCNMYATIPDGLILTGAQFTFGNGSGILNKSAFMHSNHTYYMSGSFKGRTDITSVTIPNGVSGMYQCFSGCTALTTVSAIPSSVTSMRECFNNCTSLTTAPAIPVNVNDMRGCFKNCASLAGAVTINATQTDYDEMFQGTTNEIVLLGSSQILETIASDYNNVYVWSLFNTIQAVRDEQSATTVDVSVDVSRFNTGNLTSLVLSKDGEAQEVTWNDPTFSITSTPTTFTTTLVNIGESNTPILTVIATDQYGSATAVSVKIPVSFYTMDVKAGGKEVAFGALADDTLTQEQENVGLFKCSMEARFDEDITANEDIYLNGTLSEFIDWDGSSTPSEQVNKYIYIRPEDDNTAWAGSFGTSIYPTASGQTQAGAVGAYIGARHPDAGVNNWIVSLVNPDGTRGYSVSDPAKFRSALGIEDVIVSQGTTTDSRGWWRKWSSGRAEYWYHYNVSGVTTAVWISPIYYMDTTVFSNIWSGVFNSAPFAVYCSSNSSQFISISATSWNANGVTGIRYISVGSKSSQTVPTSIYAIGTWK